MMGYSYSSDNGPIMCFNAAKSWRTGWYADKTYKVEPTANDGTECFEQDLYGIADFDNENAKYVLVKINDSSSTDHYVTFNSRKGINSGTEEAGNQVTVTTTGAEGSGVSESVLVAKLRVGGEYEKKIGGKDMVVKVESIDGANKARVRISENGAECTTSEPTKNPTVPPTNSQPTDAPSAEPTKYPTDAPTPAVRFLPHILSYHIFSYHNSYSQIYLS